MRDDVLCPGCARYQLRIEELYRQASHLRRRLAERDALIEELLPPERPTPPVTPVPPADRGALRIVEE